MNRGDIAKIWDDIQILYKLVKDPDWVWEKKIEVIATLLYLILPCDTIPDIMPHIGFIDDIIYITFVLSKFKVEIEEYRRLHLLDK